MPMNSWPMRCPSSVRSMVLYGHRSLPQMQARVMVSSASVGSFRRASGTFSTRTSPAPYMTVARMGSILTAVIGEGARSVCSSYSPLPLIVNRCYHTRAHARIKHERHVPGLQATSGILWLQARADMRQVGETRYLRCQQLFVAVEVSANLCRQPRHPRWRNKGEYVGSRLHSPRRLVAKRFPGERCVSTAAFGCHLQSHRVTQFDRVKRSFATQKFDHTPRRRVERGTGMGSFPPDSNRLSTVLSARFAGGSGWQPEAG